MINTKTAIFVRFVALGRSGGSWVGPWWELDGVRWELDGALVRSGGAGWAGIIGPDAAYGRVPSC